MSEFIDLGASIFDRSFTLDPYPVLEPLYRDPDILGFHSQGMNFCFRFDDCHDLIAAHRNVAREPLATAESEAQAKLFAEQYPARAWHYHYSLTDVKIKAVLNRYLVELLDRFSTELIDGTFATFRQPGRHEDYMADVRLLPMRILLTAWGFTFSEEELAKLYDTSVALVKSFDNFDNVELLQAGEEGMAYNREYVEEQYRNAPEGTLIRAFADDLKELGAEEDYGTCALVTFLQSTPNTISVSTAFMLRNILRYREAANRLRENGNQVDDNVTMEFLRRDNHVKALARQVHKPFTLHNREMRPGESLYIFYPGTNLDPTHWDDPLALDFNREFTQANQNIFGGARYACIGRRIALKYYAEVLPSMLANLSDTASVIEDDIEVDADWVAERVITKLPIMVP